SFRTASNLNAANPSRFGVSAGMGVETEWRRLRIAPRARCTRWADDRWTPRTRADQLEFLAGLSYAATSGAHPLGRRISLGAVAGTNVSDEFAASTHTTVVGNLTYRTSSVRSAAVGPLVELSLSPRFSIEGNAITRSIRGVTKVVSGDCPTPELRVCR